MIEIRPATEDEVILAFLQAEVNSSRYGLDVVALLESLGWDRSLIDAPFPTDAAQNEARRRVLAAYRGYPNQYLFRGFPSDVAWRRVQLELADLGTVRYANHPVLLKLSGGSRLIADGISKFEQNPADHPDMAHIPAVLSAHRGGAKFAPLILVEGADRSLILAEGHTRATVYVMAGHLGNIEAFVGLSASMSQWAYY